MSLKRGNMAITKQALDARYAGKPFLRLLDAYVLNAIDQLQSTQREILSRLEPKLVETYRMSGTWQEIVAAQMDLPEGFPDTIRKYWTRYLDAARAQGASPVPEEFAMSFVDQNLSGRK
jgi:hypothetical protein